MNQNHKTRRAFARFTIALTAALLLAPIGASAADMTKKLKVFILAGQSNMEGHAKVETFDYIGDDPATAPLLKMMRGADGKPAVAEGAWISYLTGHYDGSANGEGLGKLTAGSGARSDQPTKDGGKIGPEFTFGLLATALGNLMVGLIGGESTDARQMEHQFWWIAIVAAGIAVLLMFLAKPMRRWMAGIE